MDTRKMSLTTLIIVALVLGIFIGAFGLAVGRAQAPKAKPTVAPIVVVPDVSATATAEPTPASGSINGRVWHDLCAVAGEGPEAITPSPGCVRTDDGGYEANSLLETGEPGIGGIVVQLGVGICPALGLAATSTDSTGAYAFTGLVAGTYCLSVDALSVGNEALLPGSWTFPATHAKRIVASYEVALREGERKAGVNFGWDYQSLPPPAADSSQPTAVVTPAPAQPTPTTTPARAQPTATSIEEPTQTSILVRCTDKATYVQDVTIPDNTYLWPGQSFIKTWRLHNSGTCIWTEDYDLVFVGGDRIGGPGSAPLAGNVEPGETVDLSVALTAPTDVGTYRGKWQLRNADGKLFGVGREADNPFWVKIVVGPVPQPTATPPGQSANNWRGEYYGNGDLTGAPALVRDDREINFNWGSGGPAIGLPADGFSVRWTRTLFLEGGAYSFYALCDDGVRVWLDGELIIDQWRDSSAVTYTSERTLGGAWHALRVEYYENWGTARMQFWWERLGDFPQWRGEYFSNINLTGLPTLVRNDAGIHFDWGRGAPAAGLPADEFSVRWTRTLSFDEGLYRFYVSVDDGARVFVDDVPVINAWTDGARRDMTGDYRMPAGYHTLTVEYYERTGDATMQLWWEKINVCPDWQGEYWSNPNLSGSPALVRNDVTINFNWKQGAPAANLPSNSFSVRWTRVTGFDADTYRFHVIVDDGARLWVDDRLVIDAWRDGAGREVTADVPLAAGQHSLRLEYYERGDNARIKLWWDRVTPVSYPDWKGEYWSNRELKGTPARLRNDKTIDFSWGKGAPVAGLPSDGFSARWSRHIAFERGRYLFSALADDGFRLYLDGTLLVDEWHESDANKVYMFEANLDGTHALVVEYYEHRSSALVKFWWQQIGEWPRPTLTPTATPISPTPTPTLAPTATPVPPTATPVPPTVTPVPPTATPVPPTVTPVPPTATPVPPTATPERKPIVLLNEILAAPVLIDWDGDGTANEQDEWIELFNAGTNPIDLGGWALTDGESDHTIYRFPWGVVLEPGALVVIYQRQTGLVLDDDGGEVRLLGPEGRARDRVDYPYLTPDASYSRDEHGVWHSDWPPTPDRLNEPSRPMAVSQAWP
jgi:hypothetical protein